MLEGLVHRTAGSLLAVDVRQSRVERSLKCCSMVMGKAALLAWFGSELADVRLLILAVLVDTGGSTVDDTCRRLGIDVATAARCLDVLMRSELIAPADDGVSVTYQTGGTQLEHLVEGLRNAEPAPRRSQISQPSAGPRHVAEGTQLI